MTNIKEGRGKLRWKQIGGIVKQISKCQRLICILVWFSGVMVWLMAEMVKQSMVWVRRIDNKAWLVMIMAGQIIIMAWQI